MGEYFDLGGYTRPVTASSPEAQPWFNRGLVWAYAFNHEEAVALLRAGHRGRPRLRHGHWGVAYALGPNYNKPWEAFDQAELALVAEAFTGPRRRGGAGQPPAGAAPVERALIARPGRPLPGGRARRRTAGLERGLRRGDARGLPVVTPATSTSPRCSPTR